MIKSMIKRIKMTMTMTMPKRMLLNLTINKTKTSLKKLKHLMIVTLIKLLHYLIKK